MEIVLYEDVTKIKGSWISVNKDGLLGYRIGGIVVDRGEDFRLVEIHGYTNYGLSMEEAEAKKRFLKKKFKSELMQEWWKRYEYLRPVNSDLVSEFQYRNQEVEFIGTENDPAIEWLRLLGVFSPCLCLNKSQSKNALFNTIPPKEIWIAQFNSKLSKLEKVRLYSSSNPSVDELSRFYNAELSELCSPYVSSIWELSELLPEFREIIPVFSS